MITCNMCKPMNLARRRIGNRFVEEMKNQRILYTVWICILPGTISIRFRQLSLFYDAARDFSVALKSGFWQHLLVQLHRFSYGKFCIIIDTMYGSENFGVCKLILSLIHIELFNWKRYEYDALLLLLLLKCLCDLGKASMANQAFSIRCVASFHQYINFISFKFTAESRRCAFTHKN